MSKGWTRAARTTRSTSMQDSKLDNPPKPVSTSWTVRPKPTGWTNASARPISPVGSPSNTESAFASWRRKSVSSGTLPRQQKQTAWVAKRPVYARPFQQQGQKAPSALDDGLAHLNDFLDDVLRQRAETIMKQSKSKTSIIDPFNLVQPSAPQSSTEKTGNDTLETRLREAERARSLAEEKLSKALQDKIMEAKKRLELETANAKLEQAQRELEKECAALRKQQEENIRKLQQNEEESFAKHQEEGLKRQQQLQEDQGKLLEAEGLKQQEQASECDCSNEEVEELRATLQQLVEHIQARENDLQAAMKAIEELESENEALRNKIKDDAEKNLEHFVPKIEDELQRREIEEQVEEWKAKFVAEYESKMNQEREEYAAKLRKQFNEEKERDMIEYLRNQEEQRKKYEESTPSRSPLALPEVQKMTPENVVGGEMTKVRRRFPSISSITEDLIMSGRTEHDVEELLTGVAASVKAILALFENAKDIKEKLLLGDDATSPTLPGLVRGGLSTSLVKVLLHRFKRERTAEGKFHIWDAIVAATEEEATSDEFARFCEAVGTCSAYTKDKHKAGHSLHVWMYIIASSNTVCTKYYKSGAMLCEPEPLAVLVNSLRPLSHGTLPFRLALDFEDRK